MKNAAQLTIELERLVTRLEDDLRQVAVQERPCHETLQCSFKAATAAGRTGLSFEIWREDFITQSAVAWVLASVFVRFIEDNDLIAEPMLAGTGTRLARAQGYQDHYFQEHPRHSNRDYLLAVYREVAKLPTMDALFNEKQNPLFSFPVSADGGRTIVEFWRQLDERGEIRFDFADEEWNTRFLGDLYQDLSESARKKYALLQTPEFIEEFILDRTLTPAINEFGFAKVRLIDPTCGSGHFLLGGFHRLLKLWLKEDPGANIRTLVQRALDAVYGVDINPFAAAIARFRLLIAALKASEVKRLKAAPNFKINIAVGDSLLHGKRSGGGGIQQDLFDDKLKHYYETEDAKELDRILKPHHYHAVVGNPPYITVKDNALNEAYRHRFSSCHRKYSLSVPFMERFFDLAIHGGDGKPAGRVGQITSNSFMKREFGKKLIEAFIPKWDLTHVIDTAGAYIPGHGTPTVILFGRNAAPVDRTIRAVLGIRGEPSTPDDPAKGKVWSAILDQVDRVGSQSEFVSVADMARASFHKHPWSIGGGGAAELKEVLDEAGPPLNSAISLVGVLGGTNADEVMLAPSHAFLRSHVESTANQRLVIGDAIRDWSIEHGDFVTFPYKNENLLPVDKYLGLLRWLWPSRTVMGNRATFSKLTYFKEGRPWWEWHQICLDRLRTPLSIAFAHVATHNHFVLERGGKVFNRSAPIIKLAKTATEVDHLGLLGLLNSSTACFWMKQVFHCKGSTVDQHGARQRTDAFEDFFDHDGTKLLQFPLPADRPLDLARRLDTLARELSEILPSSLAKKAVPIAKVLADARARADLLRAEMIALQEELDWECYRLYGLVKGPLILRQAQDERGGKDERTDELPGLKLGERAFEIVMARKMAKGELETRWFERHRSTPITEIPAHWPKPYRALVEKRIALIESEPYIKLIEKPEYKRRWNTEPWEESEQNALRSWLLDRLEDRRYWPEPVLASVARLADRIRDDADFMQVAAIFRGRADFDLVPLLTELIDAESVPNLPVFRYTESGLRTRELWEKTWDLQRKEDAIDARPGLSADEKKKLKTKEVGDIPVPPKYAQTDFQKTAYWKLRGKLDVPKERFIRYTGAERGADPSPVIGWAGWTHLDQAQALAGYAVEMRQDEGWPADRLAPILAGILELIPWLHQWYNDLDPIHKVRMGDYYAEFVEEEARAIGLSLDDLKTWKPIVPAGATRRGRRKQKEGDD